jgi:general secretion pathway protein A
MLQDYYELAEEPFGVTPDPRFLYLGTQHREALASLTYGTESNRGFLALIAKPGMGKTSLLYQYLESLRGKARTAFVFRTDCDSREFIRHVLLDLGIDVTGKDLPTMQEALNQVLAEEMRAGRRFVLVIDEAQNLDESVLESVRMLSNFETPWMKLMQIVIAGQPTLAEKLSRPSMTQLRQRISQVIRVAPLNREEINAYIDHRLWVAGCKDSALFTAEARSVIAEHCEGIPRKINNICFNAMSLAFVLKQKTIGRATVLQVLANLDLDSLIENLSPVTRARGGSPGQLISAAQRLTKGKALWFRVWTFAAVAAIASALAIGVRKGGVRAASPSGRIDSPVAQPLPVTAQIPTNARTIGPLFKQQQRSVRISQGQTLYRISVQNLGRYDSQILEEISNLNPWLNDPTRIRAGRQILIPSVPMSPAAGLNPSPKGLSSSLQELAEK